MTIPFVGGPYDGLKLGVVEIERHLIVLSLPTRRGPRRFIYLPDPRDWPEVLDGRKNVSNSREFHYYELMKTAHGLEARFDGEGLDFKGSIAVHLERGGEASAEEDGCQNGAAG